MTRRKLVQVAVGREHDAPLQELEEPADAVGDEARRGVRLLEVDVRRVEDERRAPAERRSEAVFELVDLLLGHRRAHLGECPRLGVVVDVEVLRPQPVPPEALVGHLVAPEVVAVLRHRRRCDGQRRRRKEHERAQAPPHRRATPPRTPGAQAQANRWGQNDGTGHAPNVAPPARATAAGAAMCPDTTQPAVRGLRCHPASISPSSRVSGPTCSARKAVARRRTVATSGARRQACARLAASSMCVARMTCLTRER